MRFLQTIGVALLGLAFVAPSTADAGDRRYQRHYSPPPVHPCSNGYYVSAEICPGLRAYPRYRGRGQYRPYYRGHRRSDADKALQVLDGLGAIIIGADTIVDALEGDKRHRGSRGDWYYKGR